MYLQISWIICKSLLYSWTFLFCTHCPGIQYICTIVGFSYFEYCKNIIRHRTTGVLHSLDLCNTISLCRPGVLLYKSTSPPHPPRVSYLGCCVCGFQSIFLSNRQARLLCHPKLLTRKGSWTAQILIPLLACSLAKADLKISQRAGWLNSCSCILSPGSSSECENWAVNPSQSNCTPQRYSPGAREYPRTGYNQGVCSFSSRYFLQRDSIPLVSMVHKSCSQAEKDRHISGLLT